MCGVGNPNPSGVPASGSAGVYRAPALRREGREREPDPSGPGIQKHALPCAADRSRRRPLAAGIPAPADGLDGSLSLQAGARDGHDRLSVSGGQHGRPDARPAGGLHRLRQRQSLDARRVGPQAFDRRCETRQGASSRTDGFRRPPESRIRVKRHLRIGLSFAWESNGTRPDLRRRGRRGVGSARRG